MKTLILITLSLFLVACDSQDFSRDSYRSFSRNCYANTFVVNANETPTHKTFSATCQKSIGVFDKSKKE